MKKILSALMSISLLAVPAFAVASDIVGYVINGKTVAKQDYQDHSVRAVFWGEVAYGCGAFLFGGKYLLSAHHCIWAERGSEIQVTVNQGTNAFNPDRTSVRTGTVIALTRYHEGTMAFANHRLNVATELASSLSGMEGEIAIAEYYIDFYDSRDQSEKDSPVSQYSGANELALVVLDEPVPHQSGWIISPMFDFDTGEQFLTEADDIVFRGWGGVVYDMDNPRISEEMQEGVFRLSRDYLRSHTAIVGSEYDVATNRFPMCDAFADECSIRWDTAYGLVDIVGQDIGFGLVDAFKGDSGGPIVSGDKYFGALFGADSVARAEGNYNTLFSEVTWYLPLIAQHVNEVTYPTDIGLTLDEGDTQSHIIKVPVQNFTQTSVNVGSASVNGEAFSVYSDCNQDLAPYEGCMIEIEFNAVGSEITETIESSVNLGLPGVGDLPLTVRVSVEVPEVPEEGPGFPVDSCEVNPYQDHCDLLVTCSIDPYYPPCVEVCEDKGTDAFWCEDIGGNEPTDPETPETPETPEVPDAPKPEGGGSSGGSTSLFALLVLVALMVRRRV